MPSLVSDSVDKRRIGRFRLDDLILGDESHGLWRAYDEVLKRQVSVRLVPASDPRQASLRAAACTAARVVDRHVARVLDVLEYDSTLVIVTEWVDGIPLDQLLDRPISVGQALSITREVTAAVVVIHEAGTVHGRLRPASVMLNDDGEVRLRNFGIDAQIWGVAPGNDPAAADIHGVGAILMACLTSRWPGSPRSALRPTPMISGKLATPSQLRADLPAEIDDFVVRCLATVPSGENVPTNAPFKTIGDVREVLTAMSVTEYQHAQSNAFTGPNKAVQKRKRDQFAVVAKRTAGCLVGLLAIGTIAFVGTNLVSTPNSTAPKPSESAPPNTSAGSAEKGVQAPTSGTEVVNGPLAQKFSTPVNSAVAFPIAGVSSIERNSGFLQGGLANNAIDGDFGTTWYTQTYPKSQFGKNAGPALIVDLGSPQPISVIDLALAGTYTDIEIRTSNKPSTKIADFHRDAVLDGAPSRVSIREPLPVTARYVMIVLKGLPWSDAGYRAGVSSIDVRGS